MGQYLGGVVNVVVGFYTGNVWEMAGGVMQIVGTKTNNSDLATAGAVVGTVAGVAGAMSASSAAASSGSSASSASTATTGADTSFGATGGVSTAAGGTSPVTGTLNTSSSLNVGAAPAATTETSTAGQALSTFDKVKNALSTPTGIQVATGVIGGVGNAYGQAYAAQKQAEAQQTLQAQQIAFHQWQAGIANTAGTGVVGASTPAPASNGLLGPITAAPVVTNGLPVPATTNPLTVTPTGLKV